jgi:YVTN family beta-propeller protein
MTLVRFNVRPRLHFAVIPIVAILLFSCIATTTTGVHHAGSAVIAQLPQAMGTSADNSTTGLQAAPPTNPGAIIATLVLKNGTVFPGNYVGGGVGVVASAIEYDSANGQLYVPNSAQSNSTFTNSLIGFYGSNESITGKTQVGQEPDAVAYDSLDGYLYVANLGSANVSVVDPATGSVVKTVAVGTGPIAIVFDAYSGYLFVANSGSDNVTIINGSNQKVVSSVGTGTGTDALAYDSQNGNVYVASEQSSNLTVINGTTGSAVGSLTAGAVGVTALAWASASGYLYATGGNLGIVYVIDPTNDTVAATIPDPFYPVALQYDPLNGYLYAANDLAPTYGNVTVINTTNESIVGTVSVGTNPSGIAVDLASGYVFITNSPIGTVSVLNPSAAGTQVYLTSVTVAPRFSDLVANQSEVLSATPICYPGSCVAGVSFTWQLANNDGSLNRSTGNQVTFLAGDNQSSETVSVQASLNGSTAFASALVNISSPLQSVGISPAFAVVPVGGNATFHATPSCSPEPCSGTLSYSWSLNNTLGSLNATSGSDVRFAAGAVVGNSTLQVFTHLDGAQTVASARMSIVAQSFGASLSESVSSGPSPLAVAFNATGIGGQAPYTFVWAFGDGLTGTGADVQHTYTAPGSYSVVLIGYDALNRTTHLDANVVAYAPPSSGSPEDLAISLSGTPVTGPAPLATTLSAAVAGGTPPYTYEWSFGDNSTQAVGASVTHSYGQPGTYIATVYASDALGNAAETGVFISVFGGAAPSNRLAVAVTVLSLHGASPLNVVFYPAVVGGTAPYTLSWAFGDGSSNLTTQNVVGVSHVFTSAGTFFPSLEVRDSSGAIASWTVDASAHPLLVSGSPGPSTSPWPVTTLIAVGTSVALILIVIAVVRRAPRTPGTSDQRSPYREYRGIRPTPPAVGSRSSVAANSIQEEDPEGDML